MRKFLEVYKTAEDEFVLFEGNRSNPVVCRHSFEFEAFFKKLFEEKEETLPEEFSDAIEADSSMPK